MSTAAYPSVRPHPPAVKPGQLILDVVGRTADEGGVPVVSVDRAADAHPGKSLDGTWPRCMARDARQHLTVGGRPLLEIASVIGAPFLVRDATSDATGIGGPTVVVLRLELAALDQTSQHPVRGTHSDEPHRQVDGDLVAVCLGNGTPSSSQRARR